MDATFLDHISFRTTCTIVARQYVCCIIIVADRTDHKLSVPAAKLSRVSAKMILIRIKIRLLIKLPESFFVQFMHPAFLGGW